MQGKSEDKKRSERVNKQLNTLPIASWEYPRILLGVPKERAISYADEVFDNFMMIAATGVALVRVNYGRTDVVRNRMAMGLLESNYTHLLMLDADHEHPVDIVQRLARWVMMDSKVQVVGGLNFKRSSPYEPCAFLYGEDGSIYQPAEWEKGLIEVDALGTGSIMIAREVFEEIQPPWFYNLYDEVWMDSWPGEDIGFSKKCREAGIKMWVDTTTTSPHITTRRIGEGEFRDAIKTSKVEIIDLAKK